MTPLPTFVPDANVLMDYCHADQKMLQLASKHVASIIIPSPVLEEIQQLTPKLCAALQLRIIEPPLAHLMIAARQCNGLSMADHLCLVLAQKQHAACITNDGRLRRECHAQHIEVLDLAR